MTVRTSGRPLPRGRARRRGGPRRGLLTTLRRHNPPTYTAVATGTETYTEYATGAKEHHDAATDPFQRDNTVATVPPDRLAGRHATLTALQNCHGGRAAGHGPP